MTQQQILLKALAARGWHTSNSRTTRYVCLVKEGANGHLYVGRKGALRFGSTVTDSIPVDGFRQQMLAEGSRA